MVYGMRLRGGRSTASGRIRWDLRDELELRRDRDAPLQRSGDGTSVHVEPQHPVDHVAFGWVGAEPIPNVDPADEQDAVVALVDVALYLRDQPALPGGNVARLQRASQGPRQSAAGRGDDVVEGGGVRLEVAVH